MKHLHLLIPDLFLPQDIATEVCAGLHLPALERLLGRAASSTSPAATLEDRLCGEFGAQAAAPVRAAADGLDAGEGYWLCADPVNLQLQRAQMLLIPDVEVSREEADALCDMLNVHFAGTGMQFFAPHPQRWYVRLDEEPQLATSPLRQAAWCDAKFHQPQGADALRWQRIITEIQMSLYAHPLNQAREVRGEFTIGSLWLWGGGRALPLQRAFDAVGGDSALAGAFARTAGVPQADTLPMLAGDYASVLWVCEAPGSAALRGDLHAWREAVQGVEHELARALLRALQIGHLRQLILEVPGGNGSQRFELSRGDAWKLWCVARPLARYGV